VLRASLPKIAICILGVFTLLFTVSAHAADSLGEVSQAASTQYFAEFYTYEGTPKSHPFARFFKMENGAMTEVHDISWLPAPNYFRRSDKVAGIVPGHNYSLGETMGFAAGKKIQSDGQFPISPALFQAAKRRKAELEQGTLEYVEQGGAGHPNAKQAVAGVLDHLKTGLPRDPGQLSIVKSFLETGEMGPKWKNGGTAVASSDGTVGSGYRTPITHGSQGVRIYPAGIAPIPNRRPTFFRSH